MKTLLLRLSLLLFLSFLSLFQLAPGLDGCPDCGKRIELGYQQKYQHSIKVVADVSYRLKLSIEEGALLFHESKLRVQGTLLCKNTKDTIACDFLPFNSGTVSLIVTSESKTSVHTLWFEKQ